MHRSLFVAASLALALSACTADPTPEIDEAATPPPLDQPALDQPAENVPPATVAAAPSPSGPARMDGYGALDFGMTAEEAREAWTDGKLDGAARKDEPEACFHLNPADQPAPAHLAFMFEDDLFVRYSAENDAMAAPGGGKRGMSEDELQKLYDNALQSMPHKYVEGGKYLSVDASGVAPTKLVFETDAAGRVTEWRVGISPQVDYVEGCS